FWKELTVAADHLAIEVDFTSAVIFSLDAHHVPVHLTAIAIVRFFVGLTGREMKRTGDFFIEKDITHRLKNVRVKPERKLADVARARVRVQDLVELLRFVAARFLDFALLEIE